MKAREFWDAMQQLSENYSVEFSRFEKGELYQTGEYIRQGEYGLIQSKIKQDTSARLVNPEYRATINKRGDTPWKIRWLGTDKTVMSEPESGKYDDMFYMQICNPVGISAILSDPSLARDLRLLKDGSGIGFSIPSMLPTGCGVHPSHAGSEVRFHGPVDHFPTECEVIYPGKENVSGVRIRFDGFKTIDGIEIPAIVKVAFIDEFGGVSKDPSEYHYEYDNFAAPVDTERCYLRHYGLPEPRGGSRWPMLAFGTVILIALVSVFAVWRNRIAKAS